MTSSDPTEAEASAFMDCAEFSRTLDQYLDGELASREESEVALHLASCEACRSLADAQTRLREGLRARLRVAMGPGSERGRAPEELKQRIRASLLNKRPGLARRLLSPVSIAALAACAAGALVVFATHGGTDPLVEEAVRKHSRDLPLEMSAALGPESVARWFTGKLDFNASLPRFSGSDVRLIGARLSDIQNRPAAYVRYDLPRGHLGLFILDDPDRHFGEVGRVVKAGPSPIRVINARGFNVAVWRRDEIVYSLVSDLDESDLAELVKTAQGHAH
ncbi:MAG TPA: zf-HC2 domain-containing protein [Anaeromyxobacteraceae bacterium]|nr:zf-HC2 domain-containing protein [Anaeromyxobacteraceae bacterium]